MLNNQTQAIVCEGIQITYRELNQRANQLAYYLQKRGIYPEKFVGICLERSSNVIVGILGILKAGGVYVPIDPAYPKERILHIRRCTGINFINTEGYG